MKKKIEQVPYQNVFLFPSCFSVDILGCFISGHILVVSSPSLPPHLQRLGRHVHENARPIHMRVCRRRRRRAMSKKNTTVLVQGANACAGPDHFSPLRKTLLRLNLFIIVSHSPTSQGPIKESTGNH